MTPVPVNHDIVMEESSYAHKGSGGFFQFLVPTKNCSVLTVTKEYKRQEVWSTCTYYVKIARDRLSKGTSGQLLAGRIVFKFQAMTSFAKAKKMCFMVQL